MSDILREIYRGEYDVLNGAYDNEVGQIGEAMEHQLRKIKEKAPAELHPMLDEYGRLCSKRLEFACERDFQAGFRLGAQLLIAALT